MGGGCRWPHRKLLGAAKALALIEARRPSPPAPPPPPRRRRPRRRRHRPRRAAVKRAVATELVAATSGSVFHAGPSQAMHSLEGEGAVVSVRLGRVPQRRVQARGGRRRRAQAQARGSGEASGRCRERESALARQLRSDRQLALMI